MELRSRHTRFGWSAGGNRFATMTTVPGQAPSSTSSLFDEAVRQSCLQRVERPWPIIVVGSGGIARDAHLPAYRKAQFPVSSAVDADFAKASALAKDFDIPHATTSIEAALERTSGERVFDVAVPAPALLKVLPLLPDGAAVLIQKPMGETLEEAHAIVDLCHRKGLTAAVNFQLRWAPTMLAARRITDAGASRATSRYRGANQRPHALAALELPQHRAAP